MQFRVRRLAIVAGLCLPLACSVLADWGELGGGRPEPELAPVPDAASPTGQDASPIVVEDAGGTPTTEAGCNPCLCASCSLLASGQPSPSNIVARNGLVYWVNAGDQSIRIVNRPNFPTFNVSLPAQATGGIAVNSTSLSWTRGTRISSVNLDGTSERTTYTGASVGSLLAVTSTLAFWSTTGQLRWIPLGSDSGAYNIAGLPTSSTMFSIAVDPVAAVYYGVEYLTGGGGLYRYSSGGGGPIFVRNTTLAPIAMCATATELIWAERSGFVSAVPKSAGDVVVPRVFTTSGVTTHLACDTERVYWIDERTGSVFSCAQSGCPTEGPTLVAKDVPGVMRVAVDDTYVYYTHASRGVVVAVPKR